MRYTLVASGLACTSNLNTVTEKTKTQQNQPILQPARTDTCLLNLDMSNGKWYSTVCRVRRSRTSRASCLRSDGERERESRWTHTERKRESDRGVSCPSPLPPPSPRYSTSVEGGGALGAKSRGEGRGRGKRQRGGGSRLDQLNRTDPGEAVRNVEYMQ
jgi:hypothetical protein